MCVLFVPWFVSGIVMMYGGEFPEIREEERLERAAVLDVSKVRVGVAEAWGRDSAPDEARLGMQDGRPVYRFRSGHKRNAVYADDGSVLQPESFARVAAAWSGLDSGAAKAEALTEPDQWTVQSPYRALRPLTRFTWPNGDVVYVSHQTGEVVQATTSQRRLMAYCGAVMHWLYFLPLRRNPGLWNNVVVWASGIGTAGSFLGVVIGLWLYSPLEKKYRHAGRPSSVGFTGQKRWHTILGLVFGLSTCGWVFSGLLSMDPIPAGGPPGGEYRTKIALALRAPLDLRQFDAKPRVNADFAVKEVEFVMAAGQPIAVAYGAGRKTSMPPLAIAAIARQAVAPVEVMEVRDVAEYETYYGDRKGQHPLPVTMVRLADADHSAFYIDAKTARIAQSHDTRSRWNRWLYQGLHLMDLPALYQNRPLWDVLMLVFLLGGTAISVTSVILGIQVLQRKLGAR